MAISPWLVGGLGGALPGLGATKPGKKFLFGDEGKQLKFDTLRPEQLQVLMQLLEQLQPAQSKGLSRLKDLLEPGGGEAGDAFAAPYMRQFNEQVVPGIAERFAGMGSEGSLSSSGFQQSLGQAGSRLSESLAAMREGLGQQALGMLPQFIGLGSQPTYQSLYQQPTRGLVPGLLEGIGQGAAKAGMAYLGGGF